MSFTAEQKKVFGENVWLRRNLLGMSKEELAKAYGVGVATINCYERGANIAPRNKMKSLSKILKCSVYELLRPYHAPKISFLMTNEIIEKKEENILSDEDVIKAASEVFVNSYNSKEEFDNMTNVNIKEDSLYGHPVVDRVNKYLKDNNMSQSELAKRASMSSGTMNRIVHGVLSRDNHYYVKIENYLNSVENNTNNKVDNIKEINTTRFNNIENTERINTEESKPQEKTSISDRMNSIYNTLFNALAELDELKADIDKIEKVTAMLKEIQGL